MATLKEVEDAIVKAHAAGNMKLVRDLGAARKQMLAGGGGGGGAPAAPAAEKAPAPPVEGTDEAGYLQQLFDIKNPETGESYLYGNKPKPTQVDDSFRVAGDTASRGYLDKLTGNKAYTDAARNRMPGYAEAPLDIITAIASSPYRVGSSIAGGVAGGLEGAANEYGHQKNWVPNMSEAGDILYEGGKGAALGSGAAKAGEWLGQGINALRGPKPPYKTPQELLDAGDDLSKRKRLSKSNRDVVDRASRMRAAEVANAEGPDAFKRLLHDMDRPDTLEEKTFGRTKPAVQFPHDEKVKVTNLAHPKAPDDPTAGFWTRAARTAGQVSSGGGGWGKLFAGPLNVVAPVFDALGTTANLSKQHYDDLQSMILDKTGRLKTDKATVDMMRDYLAKAMPEAGGNPRLPAPWKK